MMTKMLRYDWLRRPSWIPPSPVVIVMSQAQTMEAVEVPKGPVVISDVIGIERSINIFSGLTREISAVAERLEDHRQRTTVLAPGNPILIGLGHRPWEDAADYSSLGAQAYEGSRGQDRAHDNLRRFVERHLVTDAPWTEGRHVTTMAGCTLWWEKTKDGTMMVMCFPFLPVESTMVYFPDDPNLDLDSTGEHRGRPRGPASRQRGNLDPSRRRGPDVEFNNQRSDQ